MYLTGILAVGSAWIWSILQAEVELPDVLVELPDVGPPGQELRDDLVLRQILDKETCGASSKTDSSAASRRVLSIGSCVRNIFRHNSQPTLTNYHYQGCKVIRYLCTCPMPERRLPTLDIPS